jgi:HTH-type transcriptional regulator / antitoxin HigA
MITNERQYAITMAQAEKFRAALDQPLPEGLDARVAKGMRNGVSSQLADLQRELDRYERLKSGRIKKIQAESILGIGVVLIQARIARNMTQRELGERISVAEQQIQRYEATMYRKASTERLQQVADALSITVQEVASLD